jgi:hypothetical protein
MAERVRENRIYQDGWKWVVYIDTNKATYTREFDDLEDAEEWQEDMMFFIYN